MAVSARVYTDPACSDSWGAEPSLRRLMVEFGADVRFTYVMGGLARDYEAGYEGLLLRWLDGAERSGMPIDPRLWSESPLASTYPACMAVKAAAEQGAEAEARYLRALREGLFCFRRKLDTTEPLVEEARGAGLDVERFRIDLRSHAIVEAFGQDLEAARAIPDEAREQEDVKQAPGGERLVFPSVCFEGRGDGVWVFGLQPYEAYRDAALAAGAHPAGSVAPDIPAALVRFGRMATVELQAVCDLPGPRAAAEAWRLAAEWRVSPTRVLTGWLWELA
ncbi:MAG: DsbA family protein [Thermoleophilaceae bacterium]